MARIAGVDLPRDKRVEAALPYIFGIGLHTSQKLLERTSILQYLTFQFFAISVLWLFPVKLILRLAFTIKYIWVTPWFNV